MVKEWLGAAEVPLPPWPASRRGAWSWAFPATLPLRPTSTASLFAPAAGPLGVLGLLGLAAILALGINFARGKSPQGRCELCHRQTALPYPGPRLLEDLLQTLDLVAT
eukprot:TRINITY_DN2267_c0_g2_i1.p1 TRINITY_DN2267_c0_g2~~TRINITY_DN2267_c0_g2_i1.p1  ORF type:complete len:108 (+),score=4.96 TRINITY_DN2267_c0_g2_i1:3-326(+)